MAQGLNAWLEVCTQYSGLKDYINARRTTFTTRMAQGLHAWLEVFMHGSETAYLARALHAWPKGDMHDIVVLNHAQLNDALHGSMHKFQMLKVTTDTKSSLTHHRQLCPVHSRPGRGCANQQRHTPPCAPESLLSCCCSQHCPLPAAHRSLCLHPVSDKQCM